jgi:hypothetical protein
MKSILQQFQTALTHQMRRMYLSRSFIAPEVDLLCLSFNVANALPELLMAQGVITGHGLGAKSNRGPEVNNRKRVREGGSPGPSKRCPGSTVKKEEISSNAHAQRIQALQGQIQALQVSRVT